MAKDKRSPEAMDRRRARQRIAYKEKYEKNREKELARRRAFARQHNDYERARHKVYYDFNAGAKTAIRRQSSEPSRGLEIARRHLSTGHIGFDEYCRFISERLAFANALTVENGRPLRKKTG